MEEDESNKKEGIEYISEFQSIAWGLDHCLLVEKKLNRVFATGFNRYGRLGLGDDKDRIKFT